MELILLERVNRLGQMGDTVTVRDGYARNFLLPQGKALRATKGNRERFENERTQLEAHNLERKSEAEAVAGRMEGTLIVVIRAAGETGQLYGSVSSRDVADALTEAGFSIQRGQVELLQPIKTIGLHFVKIVLHPEVSIEISANVARSLDESVRQAAGENLSLRNDDAFEFEPVEDDDEDGVGAAAEDEDGESDAEGEADSVESDETEASEEAEKPAE
jgi:large subunit ribosomal protein L9